MKLLLRNLVLLLLSSCGISLAQGTASSDTARLFSLEQLPNASLVIAGIGGHTITAEEFLISYEFGPAFTKRENDSKRRYLDFMIYEKLLALDGFSKGIDTTAPARRSIAEFEGDLSTEELYKEDIVTKVRITEAEIAPSMEKERQSISYEWIFKATKEEIREQTTLLAKGISFDSLFALQCAGSVHPEDRRTETTKFRLSLKNPLLARSLDTLKAGKVSAPIQAADGWYLVRITGRSTDLLSTQSDAMKIREDVRRALVQRKCDSLSDAYVGAIMTKHQPTIVRRSLDILHVILAQQLLPRDTFLNWKLRERLAARWGVRDTVLTFAGEPLVKLAGGKYELRDFLNWYTAREVNLRLPTTSPEALYASIEQLVWRMVRDKLLTQRAKARGLQRRASVQRQLRWWKDKISYSLMKSSLVDSVRWSDEDLRSYYHQHEARFRDAAGVVIPFDKAREDVLREYSSYEVTKRCVHKILELKKRYNVTVNEEALRRLHVEEENDPRAIDVYTAKTGGIFPRPAFPVIDEEWQAWN